MMRRKNNIAVKRLLGEQIIEARRFQIARQENPPARMFDQEHDTIGVVAPIDAFARRVQHFDGRVAHGRKPLATVDFADRNTGPHDRIAQLFHCRRQILEHHRRNVNRAHTKSLEQAGDGVEVVCVRM